MIRYLAICSILGCISTVALAQHLTSLPHRGVVQVPVDDEEYGLLRHLEVRGVIHGYSEIELPISEFEIAEFLRQADSSSLLSPAERALTLKYIRTYAHDPRNIVTLFPAKNAEPLLMGGLFTDKDKYLYAWVDDSTNSDLFAHGIGALELRHRNDPAASVVLGTIGGRFSGTLSGHVGYFMQTTNGEKFGDSLLALEDPLLAKNRNLAYYSHTFFDQTSAELAYNYDWFTGKIAREAVSIGGSYQNDNVILSPNVPYFDYLSIGAHVGAVRYEGIVGSLLADTLTGGAGADIPSKYIALHDLTFLLGENVELGFTDMLIYSGRFDLAYWNPFSFLKSVEHSLNDRDNGILGAHARWKIADGFETRGQIVVDDVAASLIGKGYWSNKFAYELGAMWAGALGMNDLDWMVEWTRVEPYTYSHFNPNNRFSSSQTLLGAQIGPNAQSFWTMLKWTPTSKLLLSLEAQYIQRGENVYDSTGKLLYNAGSDYTLSHTNETQDMGTYLLNGRRVNVLNLTGNVQYEIWRGFTLFLRGTKKSVDYLNEAPVTPGVSLDGLHPSQAPHEHPELLIAIGAKALF